MATQKELAAQIGELGGIVRKIGNETSTLKQKVADLEAAAQNQADASPELVAAVADVRAQLDIVDQLVPDAEEAPQPGTVDEPANPDA